MGTVIQGVAVVAAIAVLVGVTLWINGLTCAATWSGSGYPTRYDAFGGCKVEVNGRFIPEARVRATE